MHGHSEVPVSRICHIEFMAVRRKSRSIQGIEGAGVCLGLRLNSQDPQDPGGYQKPFRLEWIVNS